MPRALAIETSGRIGSIAISEGKRLLGCEEFAHGLKNAATIVPIIDRLCRVAEWQPHDVDEIYVSAGPGSFTGLRVGITVVKTLAFATGARIVAVPSANVLARNAPAEWTNLIVVLDAKRDQIFTARFENCAGKPVEREPAHLDSLAEMLRRCPRPVHLLGEGIPFHEKFIPQSDPEIIVTDAPCWRARAETVMEIGAEMARSGSFADPMTLAPIYIRRPEAEEKFDARQAS
jgi:tRNA threonylcarbamoyladenosine biosynthesis protein TsaB